MTITASKEHPRTLRQVRTGEVVRCVDQGEYLSLTSTRGYRDITGEQPAASSSTSGSSASSSGAEVPPQSATKDVWVEHAVSRGADRATAEGQSKAELITAYGA